MDGRPNLTVSATQVVEAIVVLLEAETTEIKAGRMSRVAEFADRKARLMQQLVRNGSPEINDAATVELTRSLQAALRSNLRVCRENIDTIKELIDLHLSIEREIDNDGTYGMPAKPLRRIG